MIKELADKLREPSHIRRCKQLQRRLDNAAFRERYPQVLLTFEATHDRLAELNRARHEAENLPPGAREGEIFLQNNIHGSMREKLARRLETGDILTITAVPDTDSYDAQTQMRRLQRTIAAAISDEDNLSRGIGLRVHFKATHATDSLAVLSIRQARPDYVSYQPELLKRDTSADSFKANLVFKNGR